VIQKIRASFDEKRKYRKRSSLRKNILEVSEEQKFFSKESLFLKCPNQRVFISKNFFSFQFFPQFFFLPTFGFRKNSSKSSLLLNFTIFQKHHLYIKKMYY